MSVCRGRLIGQFILLPAVLYAAQHISDSIIINYHGARVTKEFVLGRSFRQPGNVHGDSLLLNKSVFKQHR